MRKPAAQDIPALTGVRGAAAAWVLLFHVQISAGALGLAPLHDAVVLRDGWAGVDLFFVLSGFILALVHEGDFRTLGWHGVRRFAALRFFRIYPLATVVLMLILVLTLLSPGFARAFAGMADPPNLTPEAFWRTLLLGTRWWAPFAGDWNQPVWSLSVEVLGYVAFPLLAVLSGRILNRPVLAALAIGCLLFPTAVALAMGRLYNDDIFWGAPVRMAGAFTGGILLCRLHRLTPENRRALQGWTADAGILALLLCLLVPQAKGLIPLCFGAIVYGLASGQGLLNRGLTTGPAMWLGRVSFPLYLVHVMALMFLSYLYAVYQPSEAIRLAGVAIYLVAVLLLSGGLHLAVERPTHRFARRLMARVESRMSQPVALRYRLPDAH